MPDVAVSVAVQALAAGISVATLTVEADVTVGRYLKQLAEQSEAIYSVCRGDEPVETKILVDYARDLNFEVICAGKGKNNPLDPYATPESLAERAAEKQMNPKMLTSFVDGSKAMIEMASLANTTGLRVSRRGMFGPPSTVRDAARDLRPRDGRRHHRGGRRGRLLHRARWRRASSWSSAPTTPTSTTR